MNSILNFQIFAMRTCNTKTVAGIKLSGSKNSSPCDFWQILLSITSCRRHFYAHFSSAHEQKEIAFMAN